MLPSHLLRMVNLCVAGDYTDPGVRRRITADCIPYLSKHRREVLAGSFKGRHTRPAGFVSKMVSDAQLIRRTLNHAHQQLSSTKTNNVLSFAAAAQRRAASKP